MQLFYICRVVLGFLGPLVLQEIKGRGEKQVERGPLALQG